MKRLTATLLVTIALAVGSGFVTAMAGKQKTPSATATFWNGPTDTIYSDGQPYADGVRGVMCVVRTDTNQEFILNIVKTTRGLWYYFPSLLATRCGFSDPPTSTGLAVDGFANVHGIGAIQVGEMRAVRANFGAGSAGQFNFLDNNGTPPSNPWSCSTNVAVYRQNQSQWYISTSISRIEEFLGVEITNNLQIPDATGIPVTPGDTAQLNDSTPSRAFRGNYAMPFGMTVYCPSCPLPTPCTAAPCPIPQ